MSFTPAYICSFLVPVYSPSGSQPKALEIYLNLKLFLLILFPTHIETMTTVHMSSV